MKNLLTAETISNDEWAETIQAPDGLLDFPLTDHGTGSEISDQPKPITVLLAENRTIVRQGICAVLAPEKDISVIAQASNGQQAADLTERLRPDVVVINLAMACLNGMQAVRRILHTVPASRVIILARHADDAYAKQAVALGATGYLTEQISAEMLARTLREAYKGAPVFGPGISRCIPKKSKSYRNAAASRKSTCPLTSRQLQILQLIAEGNANKQTAADLSISVKTVEKHRENIMAKLGIHETASLTRYAVSAGLVKSESKTQT
jgi:DNA-binding NarL/FixJ family response regulator